MKYERGRRGKVENAGKREKGRRIGDWKEG